LFWLFLFPCILLIRQFLSRPLYFVVMVAVIAMVALAQRILFAADLKRLRRA
jgi:hypothetical protein